MCDSAVKKVPMDISSPKHKKKNWVKNGYPPREDKSNPQNLLFMGINHYADISHKKSAGSNNWSKFLEAEGKHKTTTTTKNEQDSSSYSKIMSSVKNTLNFLKTSNSKTVPVVTKCVAMDCEMVGIDEDSKSHMLARVSIVNAFGDCIYDKYVKPTEPVTDYRTYVSGIRPSDLETGEDFSVVQKEVADILKGKILVGHALKNDLKVLFLGHPKWGIRDTSRYKYFRKNRKGSPSLKKLAAEFLGVSIQEGEHDSIQDAKAALQLYNLCRKEWEAEKRKKRHHDRFSRKKSTTS